MTWHIKAFLVGKLLDGGSAVEEEGQFTVICAYSTEVLEAQGNMKGVCRGL